MKADEATSHKGMTLYFGLWTLGPDFWSFWSNVAVVVFGIAAAIAAGFALYFSSKLSAMKDAELEKYKADALVQISQAQATGAAAYKEAKRIESEATEKIAESNRKADEARAAAASASLAQAELERQNLELQASTAFRRLNADQKNAVAARLKQFSPQVVSIWYEGEGGSETQIFASTIADALRSAKWRVFAPAGMFTMSSGGRMGENSPIELGVQVISTADFPSRNAATALVSALGEQGFDCNLREKPEDRKSPVVIVNVLPRPEGAQGEAKLRQLRGGDK
jgi:hypothetical protein